MNNPSLVQPPPNVIAVATLKIRATREADKQRNREVGHFLKAAAMHRPIVSRSLSHARGR